MSVESSEEKLRRLARSAIADTSRKTYDARFKRWQLFCVAEGFDCLTVSAAALEKFVLWRYEWGGVCGRSVEGELAAIHTCCVEARGSWPTVEERAFLQRVMRGFKRLSGPVKHKEWITLGDLNRLFAYYGPRVCDNARERALRKAVWAVSFWGLLRPGEYATNGGEPRALVQNVSWDVGTDSASKFVSIKLTQSKTDIFGERSTCELDCCCSFTEVCPVHRLLDFLEFRGTVLPGSLFTEADGKPLRQVTIRKWLKELTDRFSWSQSKASPTPHSWRAGGATHFFTNGTPLAVVERLGRWAPGSKALRTAYLVCSNKKLLAQVTKLSESA